MARTITSAVRRAGKRARSVRKNLSKMASSRTSPRRRSRRMSGSSQSRSSNFRSSSFLGLPMWASISLGCAAFGGLVYGLMQLDAVSDMMDPVIHDVGEFFGLTEDNGIDTMNITHDRLYSSSILS